MPIKPENKAKYPKDWEAIRQRILERAGHRCELCHVRNYSVIRRNKMGMVIKEETRTSHAAAKARAEALTECLVHKFSAVVLTIAHINQNPEDNRDCNLRALCQRCHNLIDLPYRTVNAAKTREAKIINGDTQS